MGWQIVERAQRARQGATIRSRSIWQSPTAKSTDYEALTVCSFYWFPTIGTLSILHFL